ncbi:MAG: outer membrane lipoprotein-sorting protein [Candidatus Neomarinimicrobiota bacterium]|nr:outer membrane lipoprotein-sorting protein [Candidatus Neomarinimicrobiota bacterium]
MKQSLLLLVVFIATGFSQTGREIAIMIDQLPSPKYMSNETTMVLTNAKGKSRTNKMISKSVDGNEKQITWFLEPKDDKGVAFLKVEYSDRDDEMRMWLPDFKKIRRISSKRKGDSFMASDLSYEDLTSRDLDKHDYERKEDEVIDGIDCYVIEVIPSSEAESSYLKHKSWINKSTLNAVKEESFDKRGELIKRKKFSHKKVKDYYVMSEIFVENVQKEHTTNVTFDKVEVDIGVKPSLFQEKNLKRLPR